jgi:hypothetical protein
MILPGVLSFLENEPIDRIIEEFQSLGYATSSIRNPASIVGSTENNPTASTTTAAQLFP